MYAPRENGNDTVRLAARSAHAREAVEQNAHAPDRFTIGMVCVRRVQSAASPHLRDCWVMLGFSESIREREVRALEFSEFKACTRPTLREP